MALRVTAIPRRPSICRGAARDALMMALVAVPGTTVRVMFAVVLAFLSALSPLAGADDSSAHASPTTVYLAAEIITMNPAQPVADAVAVVNGRIADVGTLAELSARIKDYRIDNTFAEQVIVPGFIEQHLHPLLAALVMLSDAIISIEDWETPAGFSPMAKDQAAFRTRLAEAVDAFDAGAARPMLVWGYHRVWHGELDRAYLDSIAPEKPLLVWQRSTHEMYLNSVALSQFGIDQAYIDSWPNELARSQADLKAGQFVEAAFFEHVLFEKVFPALASPERLMASLAYTRDYYHRAGLTTLAEPAGPVDRSAQALVARAFGGDATPFNFYFIPDGRALAAMHLNSGGAEAVIAAAQDMLSWSEGRTRFLPRQAKLLLDGAIYSQLMVMRDGYPDGHEGEWIMPPETYRKVFDLYWDAGYQIHVHNLGDGALDIVLDTLEDAMHRNPRFDHRTVMVHFGYAQPDQIERIRRLGALVSANPVYTPTLADHYAVEGVGKARTERMVPLGDAVRAGVSISLHSDMPMAPAKPLKLISAAVNRVTPEGWVVGPRQRISIREALAGVTINAAYSVRLEKEIGSIEVGKLANFTILNRSPLSVDPSDIDDIRVWGTVLEGRLQPVP